MKIGIITLPLHTNYGGILQAYAMQIILKRMGHDAIHLQPKISFPSIHPWWKMPFVWVKRILRKYIGGNKDVQIFENPYRWAWIHTTRFTAPFIESHLSCRYLDSHEWHSIDNRHYDALVIGSDQVWRPKYAMPIERYFGNFIDKHSIKRIAYAASFGTDENEYSPEQQAECSRLLQQFDAVSVREQSAVAICKERFGTDAQHVLDPTMLLTSADYETLVNKVGTPHHSGNLMTYILDRTEATDAFVERICVQKRLTAFRTNSRVEDPHAPLAERIQPPVESWLRGFMDAEYVITDSFHACVFSILFHKPFICIGNNSRGLSRFHSLLKLFSLEDRLINIERLEDFQDKAIDWAAIDATINTKRKESMQFLSMGLHS